MPQVTLFFTSNNEIKSQSSLTVAQPTPVNEEPLTVAYFQPKITQFGITSFAQRWRRECVDKVIAAYNEIKASMSASTRRELYNYLRAGQWIRNARSPSGYAPFRSLRGRTAARAGHGRLYYPHLFVVHAIWGPSVWVIRVLFEFSAHWGVLFKEKLTYPKIDDPNREYLLFLGKTPVDVEARSPPRRDRVAVPRPAGVTQPLKAAQNAAIGHAKPPFPQGSGIKKELRRNQATAIPVINTKKPHAKQSMRTT
ncbi:hypothetical protein ACHAPT_007052 [Fusarium lateritium]